ncbi:SseB family protein [Zobellella denitrificans]
METQNENRLEHMLRLAADEPAHRPEFMHVLMDSTVYVLGTAGADEGTVDLPTGSKIGIQHWERQDGGTAIPFFTSLEILQKSIETEQSYLALPAKALFEMTLGTNLFLNPRSPYGKEFVPEEVKNLLALGIGHAPTQRTVQKETKV